MTLIPNTNNWVPSVYPIGADGSFIVLAHASRETNKPLHIIKMSPTNAELCR